MCSWTGHCSTHARIQEIREGDCSSGAHLRGNVEKRIEEFAATPSSALTPEEFEGIWLENEADPPSFQRSKLRKEVSFGVQHPTRHPRLFFRLEAGEVTFSTLDNDTRQENNQTFSDLDSDPEIDACLLNPAEGATKTQVWTTLNQDYLDREQAKIAAALEKAKADEADLLTALQDG